MIANAVQYKYQRRGEVGASRARASRKVDTMATNSTIRYSVSESVEGKPVAHHGTFRTLDAAVTRARAVATAMSTVEVWRDEDCVVRRQVTGTAHTRVASFGGAL